MKIFGRKVKEKAVQCPGKQGTSKFSWAGCTLEVEIWMTGRWKDLEASRRSAFPNFLKRQDVRATPEFFEEVVKRRLALDGMDGRIRAKLEGKPLVDLCCGDEISVVASKAIARHFGARLEVADLHLPRSLEGMHGGVKGTRTDALTYVLSLPDNYANFMMCGIDADVIGDEGYWQLLAGEIEKKTLPGGIVMGMGPELYRYLPDFKMIDEGTVKGAFFVMEK